MTAVPAAPGSATPLSGYAIRSTAEVSDAAAAVSAPGYRTTGWYPAGPRSTVLAALVADGKHPDPFYSTDQQRIPAADFTVPWWFRAEFTVEDTSSRTYLDFSGVVSAADVFVNGKQVATASAVAGAYTRHELDVTGLVRAGANAVAFRIKPNNPRKNLTMGWLDWLQPPPDENMGIVRDVLVRRGGPVALRDAHVVTSLALPSLAAADLTVKAQVRNDSAEAVTATLSGTIGATDPTGPTSTGIAFRRDVPLRARETKTVAFAPADTPGLHLDAPRVWWPAGMGAQELYVLDLTVTVPVPGAGARSGAESGAVSDRSRHGFGIRNVQAPLNQDGARQYSVNGRPLLVRGAGWSPTSCSAGTRPTPRTGWRTHATSASTPCAWKGTSNRTSSSTSPTGTGSSPCRAGSAVPSGRARSTGPRPERAGPRPTTRSPKPPWRPRPRACAITPASSPSSSAAISPRTRRSRRATSRR